MEPVMTRHYRPVALYLSVASLLCATHAVGQARQLPEGPQALLTPHETWEATSQQARNLRSEAVDRQTHTLSLGPNGSLELRNVAGNITCVAGTGTNTSVEVVRTSRGRTEADARTGLDEVRAIFDHQDTRATVSAAYPQGRRPQPPYAVELSYIVTAPAGTRITAQSVSGDVVIRDIRGDLTASSVSGDVNITGGAQSVVAKSVSGRVAMHSISTEGTVAAGTVSGDVLLERVKAARVEAQTVSGAIALTGATARAAALRSTSGSIQLEGAVAPAGRYDIQAHSGDVRVTVQAGAGIELQASTFSGAIRLGQGTALRAATSSSRSLRGTLGDGSGVLVVATFSGDIVVGTR
jgi:hypothetical protein